MRKRVNNEPEETSFWQSYSDMMAALLLVFVLIIASAKFSYDKQAEATRVLQESLDEQTAILEAQAAELEQNQRLVEEQASILEEQQKQIDDIIGVRTDLIAKLKDFFSNSKMNISVDPDTGAISFDSSILFDYNKAELKESGKKFLDEFFPKYFEIILSDDFNDYVAEVIIEGHTDNTGSYIYNLDLSQRRAFSVAEYCLGDNNGMFTGKILTSVRQLVTANGRSSNDLIYKDEEKTIVDPEASRRVEIKFRLSEDEMISEMSKILEQ